MEEDTNAGSGFSTSRLVDLPFLYEPSVFKEGAVYFIPADEKAFQSNNEAGGWLQDMAETFRQFYVYPTASSEPTIEDLLNVRRDIEGTRWSDVRYTEDTYEFIVPFEPPLLREKGRVRTRIALPDVFCEEEWQFIEKATRTMADFNSEGSNGLMLSPDGIALVRELAQRDFWF